MNDDNDSATLEDTQNSLGEMMRQARMQRDLSVDDLARALRLEPRIIHFLENNQFDQLPAPAFTRGYVRSIAKELNIDSRPLLNDLDMRFAAEPPALADFESRAPTQITSESNIIRYTTLAIVVVLLVLVALWWRAQSQDEAPETSVEPAATEPATPPLAYDFETITHPDDVYFQLLAEDPPATTPAATEEDGEPASLDNNIEPNEGDVSEILIEASKDAWIEVRDALGSRLYYNLVRPGKALRLSGQPPYALTIGNSAVVSVEYAGETVDLQPFSIEGIARLELGANPATE